MTFNFGRLNSWNSQNINSDGLARYKKIHNIIKSLSINQFLDYSSITCFPHFCSVNL